MSGGDDPIRIDYDDEQLSVVEKINRALKGLGLVLVDDGRSHEGYCIFTLQAVKLNAEGKRTAESAAPEDPAVTIRRLRQRLYIVEPVYRAAVALHRTRAPQTFEATERVERAVARALDSQREIAEGRTFSDVDLEREVP